MTSVLFYLHSRDLPTASDFLFTRIYEAAKQFPDFRGKRTAIIVIDDFMAWNDFGAAIHFGYFDLNDPGLRSGDAKWLAFLATIREDYPEIDNDLAATIWSLDEVRIFRLLADETLKEELVYR